MSLLIAAPKLWWPRGYGAPELYELRASLLHGDDSDGAAAGGGAAEGEAAVEGEAVAVVQRVGLRKVELVQVPLTWLSPPQPSHPIYHPLSPSPRLVQAAAQPPAPGLAAGTSFLFRVNGVDVFAKGSNLIPLDVFAPNASTSQAGC